MLKTVYFDDHHRHKWQCFRIRLVDKKNSKVDTFISNFQSAQENITNDIQTKMVFVQDANRKTNSYLEGANNAIKQRTDSMKSLAQAIR